jgi:hypothetical protein
MDRCGTILLNMKPFSIYRNRIADNPETHYSGSGIPNTEERILHKRMQVNDNLEKGGRK